MADSLDLVCDPLRTVAMGTGIYVRARTAPGKYDSVDIAVLDRASLLRWLQSRGGSNPWAEHTVLILLGHEP